MRRSHPSPNHCMSAGQLRLLTAVTNYGHPIGVSLKFVIHNDVGPKLNAIS